MARPNLIVEVSLELSLYSDCHRVFTFCSRVICFSFNDSACWILFSFLKWNNSYITKHIEASLLVAQLFVGTKVPILVPKDLIIHLYEW